LNGIHHYKPIYGVNVFTKATFRDIMKEHKCKTKHIDLYILDCRDIEHFKEAKGEKYLKEIIGKIGSLPGSRTPLSTVKGWRPKSR
jgi:hypothetical protein